MEIENRDLFDHYYALMILGNFKEPKAHKVIVDIFSLPDKLPDLIFGDLCTSELPILLFNTCDRSIDHIISMALNKKIYDFCRVSALQSLTYAVVEGYVPRKEVLKLFGTFFAGNEAEDRSDFWGLLANLVCDLYPGENMEIIKHSLFWFSQKGFPEGKLGEMLQTVYEIKLNGLEYLFKKFN